MRRNSAPVAVALVALAVLAAACSGGGDNDGGGAGVGIEPLARVERPVELPPETDAGAPRLFFSMTCAAGLLSVVTTLEIVNAELPCDRAPSQEQVAPFLGVPVTVRVEPGEPGKLFVLGPSGASFEFTTNAVSVSPIE